MPKQVFVHVTIHMLVLDCCTHLVSCVLEVLQNICTARAWSNSSKVPLSHVYGTLIATVYYGVPAIDAVKHSEYCY